MIDLKSSLRDPETADDARSLLERLRKRRDLLATIAEEIDDLLRLTKTTSASSTLPRDSESDAPPRETFLKTPNIDQLSSTLED